MRIYIYIYAYIYIYILFILERAKKIKKFTNIIKILECIKDFGRK